MVTIRDIAAAAGLSTYTVSCALRGQAQVAPATRKRVQKIAARMGYEPHTSAQILARRRKHDRKGARATIGFLCREGPNAWHPAVEAACRERGFNLQHIYPKSYPNFARSGDRLWRQGVSSIIFHTDMCPYSLTEVEQFDWSRFAVVKLNRGWPHLRFPAIRLSAFGYASMALHQVFDAGYRRVAVLMTTSTSSVDDDARLGAALNFGTAHLPPGASLDWRRIVLRRMPLRLPAEIDHWLREYRPDAVLGFPFWWNEPLEASGWRIPEDLAYAAILIPRGEPVERIERIAGCERRVRQIIDRALDMAEKQLILGQRGTVPFPEEIAIDPIWTGGPTLPPNA